MNSLNKIFMGLLTASTIGIVAGGLVTSECHAEQKYSLRVLTQLSNESYITPRMNNVGMIVGVNKNGMPTLYQPSVGTSAVGSKVFTPTGINEGGDVVGYQETSIGETYNHYLFYVPVGGASQTIAVLNQTYGQSYGIFINDNRTIVTIESKNIKFFTGATLQATVALSTSQEFTSSTPSAAVLPNGDFVVQLSDAGTFGWYRVTSAGQITLIDHAFLPAKASFLKLESDGKGLFSLDDDIFLTDFVSNEVSIKNIITSKKNGSAKVLVPTIVNVSLDSIALSEDSFFAAPSATQANSFLAMNGASGKELACSTTQQDRYSIKEADDISDTGSVLVRLYDKHHPSNYYPPYGVLEQDPNGKALTDTCARIHTKMIGSCAKYFDKNGKVKVSLPANKECTLQVKLTTADLRPLPRGRVVTRDYPNTYRGKTNAEGVMTFNFNTGSYPYTQQVIAPYGDKKSLSRLQVIPLTKQAS